MTVPPRRRRISCRTGGALPLTATPSLMTQRRRIKSHASLLRWSRHHLACFILLMILLLWNDDHHDRVLVSVVTAALTSPPDGAASAIKGRDLFAQREYEQAATELWNAVLFHGDTPPEKTYDVQEVFGLFMQCYMLQNKLADGLAFVASESFRRGQTEMGHNYLLQALEADPDNTLALAVQTEFAPLSSSQKGSSKDGNEKTKSGSNSSNRNKDLQGQTPEQLYDKASHYFADKDYEQCADVSEISCIQSHYTLGPSCANAVYCRNLIVDFGFNGTQFDRDMDRIVTLITSEAASFRTETSEKSSESTMDDEISPTSSSNSSRTSFKWRRAMSIHPHMMLGYPVDPRLKRLVTESVAYLDEPMSRASQNINKDGTLTPLPSDLPFNVQADRVRFQREADEKGDSFKLRIGFVGSGFNSKAVLFLSQDMFRFFDEARFEVHIFSFGPADDPLFIQHGMRGVDWRERVKVNVFAFHDLLEKGVSQNHIEAARYIHDQNVHILLEWDGYARQGERAQGLFALRPAPLQLLHQEYLGTSGALYVDYLFSDAIASPPTLVDELYTESIIWLPNHFFSKGHAYQSEVKQPTYDYAPKQTPYKYGTGSPIENRCLAAPSKGPKQVSFVYCNFNKLLKANPETVRSWIHILRNVPDSILCLLENPDKGVPYLRKFVHEAAGTSVNHSDPTTFVPGDGDELNSRIFFLPWERNPFDHQMRNQDFCHVMLDSHPYNGHTVAQDALYGGVPIVTRSDGHDMSSLVTTSANVVLGLQHLNAYNGSRHYEEIAIAIGNDRDLYTTTRTKLIDSALQRNPMHPYWDVARYVKNFESALQTIWQRFMDGLPPTHFHVVELELAAQGTFDGEITAHPPQKDKAV